MTIIISKISKVNFKLPFDEYLQDSKCSEIVEYHCNSARHPLHSNKTMRSSP